MRFLRHANFFIIKKAKFHYMTKYKKFKKSFKIALPWLYRPLNSYKLYIKYLITGSFGTSIDILLLYILTDIIGVWYLFSTIFVYVIAFFSSFYLQKYWTFKDGRESIFYEQLFSYFMVGLFNLSINTVGVFLLVEKFNFYYIFAQVLMFATLGIESFLVYRFIIFNRKRKIKKLEKRTMMEDIKNKKI